MLIDGTGKNAEEHVNFDFTTEFKCFISMEHNVCSTRILFEIYAY